MKLAIASDHAGYALKQEVMKHLADKGIEFEDFGAFSEQSCDYPEFAEKAGRAVASGRCERGIVICGTGLGVSIAANKIRGIRCALCNDLFTARLSREHNDANMLALGARILGGEYALSIVDAWLGTAFLNSGNHPRRVKMISDLEGWE